jgi:hypothetical protein
MEPVQLRQDLRGSPLLIGIHLIPVQLAYFTATPEPEHRFANFVVRIKVEHRSRRHVEATSASGSWNDSSANAGHADPAGLDRTKEA